MMNGPLSQRAISLLFVLGLAGCISSDSDAPSSAVAPERDAITPMQAVFAAAENPEGIAGTFQIEVRNAGRQNNWLYLNSEEDYRDQRCLTIAIPTDVALLLKRRFGGDPAVLLKGAVIRVTGTATRTKILFLSNGVPTDRYYYQTHVLLTNPSQLSVNP